MYTDGASRGNPGPASIGIVFFEVESNNIGVTSQTGSKREIATVSEAIGIATNNIAEYSALVRGLEYALQKGFTELVVKADSELMIKQLKGQYKVKNENLKPLFLKAKTLAAKFKSLSYFHVRRELNVRADELANMALG